MEDNVTIRGPFALAPPVEVQILGQECLHPPQRLVVQDHVDALVAHIAPFKAELHVRLATQLRQQIFERFRPGGDTDLLIEAGIVSEPDVGRGRASAVLTGGATGCGGYRKEAKHADQEQDRRGATS